MSGQNFVERSNKLNAVLQYLLREEDGADERLNEIEKVLNQFWDKMEAFCPAVSRNDDTIFLLVSGLIANIESASYKIGFLDGFFLAQEMEEEKLKSTHR